MLTRFRNSAYVLAYAVATIPLWHYIRDGRILAMMVAVVTFAYINVVLSTVHAAQPILSSEKAKTPLPRWLPDKLKYQKWWLLVRHTLKWHLLLIPPKMGLALGFVQWLHFVQKISASYLLNPYFYKSHNNDFELAYPQLETFFIAVIMLIIFGVINLGLLSSIIVSVQARLTFLITKKMSIVLILIGFTYLFSTVLWSLNPCAPCYLSDNTLRFNWRVEDTLDLATNSIIEQGILLAANIMRPVGYESAFAAIRWGYDETLNRNIVQSWDNRLFVARQIVAGLLGLLLYAGATWGVLWFVEDET